MELERLQIQILSVGLILLSAFLCGRITRKFELGEVVGQIVGGLLVGPSFINLLFQGLSSISWIAESSFYIPVIDLYDQKFILYREVVENFHFFVFLFLGLIAFSLGEELDVKHLKEVGVKAAIICFSQAILTWILLTLAFWLIFDVKIIIALLIGSIGMATAPAMTFIIMNKFGIGGKLRSLLANIVVLDDIIEVIFFSIFLGIAVTIKHGEELSTGFIALKVLEEFFLAFLLGFLIFLILKIFVRTMSITNNHHFADSNLFFPTILNERPSASIEILLILISVISIGISIAISLDLPFLITAVFGGFLISNFHSHTIFESLRIRNVMPIFNIFFFAIIGASVKLETFSTDSLLFIAVYIAMRLTGKILGTWGACKGTGQEADITSLLPKLILPQAGMAAVETMYVATILRGPDGLMVFNTIVPAIVIFELFGAMLAETSLKKWKEKAFNNPK
ncbi:cation:proton antiporter [Psychromonas aquimarina]|uniref:cation:proton antiporter n=1 Tax=Psychromonas aquimarina TaxID=444919 RepID=UPI000412BBCA|nr:cation:proton antiporter [Psychromonas aquimarina]